MAWFKKPETAAKIPPTKAIWQVCPRCKSYIAKDEWKANNAICPVCNYHGRLGKIDATIAKSGENESVVVGTAQMGGIPVMLGVMDFAFMGGSLGTGTGERIARACEQAIAERRPLILCSASGGARMHEGILSLMQMAKTSAAVGRLKEAGLPYISVLTDPTTGGVSASYAMLGDINITEPKALIGFAGRRVIENTIHQKLPPDFQSAEYLLAHGFIDKIVERKDLKAFIVKMLGYFGFAA